MMRTGGGRVQGVEAMPLIFDLRPIGDGEADLAERAYDVVRGLRQRMQFAEGATASGQGEIGRLLRQRGFHFQFAPPLDEHGIEFCLRGVDGLAGGGTIFLRQRAELFHQRGEFAVRSDPGALGVFERGEVGGGLQVRERGLLERFDVVQRRHGHVLATRGTKVTKRNAGGFAAECIPDGKHSTFNAQHPTPTAVDWLFLGCWAFDVECSQGGGLGRRRSNVARLQDVLRPLPVASLRFLGGRPRN